MIVAKNQYHPRSTAADRRDRVRDRRNHRILFKPIRKEYRGQDLPPEEDPNGRHLDRRRDRKSRRPDRPAESQDPEVEACRCRKDREVVVPCRKNQEVDLYRRDREVDR